MATFCAMHAVVISRKNDANNFMERVYMQNETRKEDNRAFVEPL